MKRVKISTGILFLLIAISVVIELWISHRCKAMLDDITYVSDNYNTGYKESAVKLAEELEDDWEGFRDFAVIIMKNDKLSEIDRINSRIVYLIKNDSNETNAELMELKNMIESLKKNELPFITTVF